MVERMPEYLMGKVKQGQIPATAATAALEAFEGPQGDLDEIGRAAIEEILPGTQITPPGRPVQPFSPFVPKPDHSYPSAATA